MTKKNNNDDRTLEIKSIKSLKKNKSENPNNPKKKKKGRSPFFGQRIVASILIVITVIGLAVATVLVTHTLKLANQEQFTSLTQQDFVDPPSTNFLDANGESYFELSNKYRDNISYDELSNSLIDAFVSAEDSRFFVHNGFDVPRFTMALINNVFDTLKSGKLSLGEGGSTFTMQLIKNTAFVKDGSSGEQTEEAKGGLGGIDRKLVEIFLSQKFEKEGVLSKKLILELYLNKVNFGVGNNTLGVEKSAQAYFGKSASELNTVESAFMAAVINAPNAYSPYRNISAANRETQRVVYNMYYHGYISEEEYNVARNVKIEDLLAENRLNYEGAQPYQSYIDLAYSETLDLLKEHNIVSETEDHIPSGLAMKIHTNLNRDVQSGLDKVQNREIANLNMLTVSDKSIQQVASTIVNNKTGEIIGTVGRYDYNGQRMSNLAANRVGSPGSTLKPIVVYAPAFEHLGWASDHLITDEPISYYGISWKNWDSRHEGHITLSRAISDSRNVPAIKALMDVREAIGNEKYLEYLREIGLVTSDNITDVTVPFAIGNDPLNVNTIQIAGSTASIFNEGQYIKPHTVTKIEFLDGTDTIEPDYTPVQVLSPGAAYLTAEKMREVLDTPYARVLRRSYPTYAKTGTVEADDKQASKFNIPVGAGIDRLMIAATSDFTIATWNGFEELDKELQTYFSPQEKNFNLPGNLNSYILDLLANSYGPGKGMSQPSDVVSITHIKGFFPYQTPLENMNPDLISTGKVLKKHATLTSATPQDLSSLETQNVTAEQIGNELKINVGLTPYPDAEKLIEADATLEMKDSINGRTYSGTRLYDESWIYGAVRYKTDVKVNGALYEELKTDEENHSLTISLPNDTSSVEVCSYYTFDKAPNIQSNQKCSKIEVKANTISVPDFIGQPSGLVINWSMENGMEQPAISYQQSSNQFGVTLKVTPNISGKSMTKEELIKTKLTLTVADTKINTGLTVKQFKDLYGTLMTISNLDSLSDDALITGYQIDGTTVNSFMLSTRFQKNIIILTK